MMNLKRYNVVIPPDEGAGDNLKERISIPVACHMVRELCGMPLTPIQCSRLLENNWPHVWGEKYEGIPVVEFTEFLHQLIYAQGLKEVDHATH